jgi:uroporphyrinogen-III synthase
MNQVDGLPLAGRTIGITAERRAEEQAALLTARGAAVVHGPTLHITSVLDDAELRAATDEVIAHPPDYVLASTGFGVRTWLSAAEGWGLRDDLIVALGRARIANRGSKAASATKGMGLTEWYRAPTERFTELVDRLLDESLSGCRVVFQLHGAPEADARRQIGAAGADVLEVDAYRAGLPADRGPAMALIDAACGGRLDAVTFTTAPAVHNLFALAAGAERTDELRQAFNGPVVAACVGPVCAEGAEEEGIADPLVPERSRLVPLITALTDRLRRP